MPEITVPKHQYYVRYRSINGEPNPLNAEETEAVCGGGTINVSLQKYIEIFKAREDETKLLATCPTCGNRLDVKDLII